MDYSYMLIHKDEVNKMLANCAREGWRVHTLSRSGSMVDILFERPRRDDV